LNGSCAINRAASSLLCHSSKSRSTCLISPV
jgi:hypothetical protein